MKWIVLLLPLLVACGSLDVQVAVLDPGVVGPAVDERLLQVVLPQVLAQTESDIKNLVNDLQTRHASFYVELSDDLSLLPEDQAKAVITEAIQLQNSYDPGDEYSKIETELLQNRDAIVKLNEQMLAASQEDRKDIRAQLLRELQYRFSLAELLRRMFLRDANETVRKLRVASGDLNEQAANKLELLGARQIAAARADIGRTIRSLVGHGYLLDSPHAYAVASAPEEAWAHTYNRAYGGGWFGNFNIAIKKEHQGSFTVKGLIFDPSDIARAASKLTTQAVLLSAQIAGVPVMTSTQPPANTVGAPLAQSSAELATLEAEQEQLRAAIRTHRSALRTIALTILAEYERLGKEDTRQQAIASIQATYESHKMLIEIRKGED